MFKKLFLRLTVSAVIVLCLGFPGTASASLETELLVDASPTGANVPYLKTQWYGFIATGGQGYCAILSPSAGNSDLYLFGTAFNLGGNSKNSGTAVDKVWYGQPAAGQFHIAAYGLINPSTNYTIKVITAPYIKSISLTTGEAGTLVALTGFGFGSIRGTNYVKFGSVTATNYNSWTNTQIKVYVPVGVPVGIIKVIVNVASRDSNPMNFTVSGGIVSEGTMWRYDLSRTGNYPNGPTTFPLNLKWTYAVGLSSGPSPVIANNIVYGGGWDKLYALDANTGSLKWSYNSAPSSSPAIAGGIVYFGSRDKLYALNANTGSLKWSYSVVPPSSGEILSSPAISNGTIYFNAGAKFYALDAGNGTLKWNYAVPIGWIEGSPTIANDTIYFGDSAGKIYAFNANNGSVKWTYTMANQYINDTATVANGILYFGATDRTWGGYVFALDANTGSFKWQYRTSGWYHNVAVSDGKIYCYGVNNLGPALVFLDANTGSEILRVDSIGDGSGAPSVSQGIIYVGSSDSNIYAIDANIGTIKWQHLTESNIHNNTPAIDNGKVYIISDNGKLYCFEQ